MNAADPQKVAEVEARIKRKSSLEEEDLRKVMSLPEGRRTMWRILCNTGMRRSSFTGNSETYFREGERNVGLRLQQELERIAFEDYVLMLKEARTQESA
jgi:hypothetical protein